MLICSHEVVRRVDSETRDCKNLKPVQADHDFPTAFATNELVGRRINYIAHKNWR